MLRRRVRAFLTILELVYHATTEKGTKDVLPTKNTRGRSVYEDAQTVTETLDESMLASFNTQSLTLSQPCGPSTLRDLALDVAYLAGSDSPRTRCFSTWQRTLETPISILDKHHQEMCSVASFLLSSDPVDSLEGPTDLVNYTIDNPSCLTSMQSTSQGTSEEFYATRDPISNTILEDPTHLKDVTIEKQVADIGSSIANFQLVNLLLCLSCLISGYLIVVIRQGGLNAYIKHVSLWKAEVKVHYLNAFLFGGPEILEFIGSLIILSLFGRSMLRKFQLNTAGSACHLLWNVLRGNSTRQRIELVDDTGVEGSTSYTAELNKLSDTSLQGLQEESSLLSAPSSNTDGFVTAMSVMSISFTSVVFSQPSASFISSEYVNHSSVSILEDVPPPLDDLALEMKAAAPSGNIHGTALAGVDEVTVTATTPFSERSTRTLDPLDENTITSGMSHSLLTKIPSSNLSRKLVFRHTIPSMPPGYEFGYAIDPLPAFPDIPSYLSPDEMAFATTKLPLQLVSSCPSSPAVFRVSLRSSPATSPYSRLRLEFNTFDPDEPQNSSPHPLVPSKQQPEGSTPDQSSTVPTIGLIDETRTVISLPQFLFTCNPSASTPSGPSGSPGPSLPPDNVPGPIRSNSSTFFVNTLVKRSNREVPTTPHNPFVLKTRRDISSYGLEVRNPPLMRRPTPAASTSVHRRQTSLLENKFTLPPFHLNL